MLALDCAPATDSVAAPDVLRRPEEVPLDDAFNEIEPHAQRLVQNASNGSVEKGLQVIDGCFSSPPISCNAIDAAASARTPQATH